MLKIILRLLLLLFFSLSVVLPAVAEPAWILLEKGRAEFEKRNITESLDLLLEAVEKNADFPEAEYWLGRVYQAQGQSVLAEEQYRRALDLSIYLRVPQERYLIEYTLADLLLNLGEEREAEAVSILYSIIDEDTHPGSASVHQEHSYVNLVTGEGIDELLYLYRDELNFSLKARRMLGELFWDEGAYRTSLLQSTRVILSLLTTSADRYRSFNTGWRFDIDTDEDNLNPDRDVRYPGDSDGVSDLLNRIYSSDQYLASWLEEEGFWPQLYLLSISLYAEGYSKSAESIWKLMVNQNDTSGEITPKREAGRWGVLASRQLIKPFISIGSISP